MGVGVYDLGLFGGLDFGRFWDVWASSGITRTFFFLEVKILQIA